MSDRPVLGNLSPLIPAGDDVDAVLAETEAAGATILKPAEDTDWGGYSGYFADPDDYPWEVAWNPHWKRLEDGSVQFPI